MTTQFFNPEDLLNEETFTKKDQVKLRYQSRNKNKGYTLIENFAKQLNSDELVRFIKSVKKNFNCTCIAVNSKTNKSVKDKALSKLDTYEDLVIQLQGNFISKVKDILESKYDLKDNVIVQG